MLNAYKYLLLIPILALTVSCSSDPNDDPDPDPDPGNPANIKANKWIYEQLNDVYYWYDKMKAEGTINQELSPETYFYNNIWATDYIQGFSYIEPASASTRADESGHVIDFGIQVIRWTYGKSTKRNTYQVLYVVPDSPADKAGIRRADMFSHYNGTMIDSLNYGNTFASSTVTLTRCKDGKSNFEKIDEVTLSKASYYDTPVIHEQTYEFNGQKIGYLFYAHFRSAKDTPDDTDLKDAILRMKEAGIDELILDLRYNGGGYLAISTDLATMLLPAQYNQNNTFLYQEYNDKVNEKRTILFSSKLNDRRLNLDRLHVIMTDFSASASEVTVHGLRQYMDVIHYGVKTVGKNVGSYAISGEDKNIPWIIHPISSRLYDSRGKGIDNWETFVGFTPDYLFDELDRTSDGARFNFQGQLGDYDPESPDCDPLLNFVMAKLGYTTQAPRETRAGDILSAKPIFYRDRQVLITD